MQNDVYRRSQRTYLGAYALTVDTLNRLLLCRLSGECIEAGYWTLPGGGVKWGEPPEHAVARELLEETGLKAPGPGMELVQSVFSEVYPETEKTHDGPVHHVGLLYRVREPEGVLRPEAAGTTDLCAWFTEEEARKLPLTPLARFALSIPWKQAPTSSGEGVAG